MEQLTVKQALEQGYEHFFYNSDGWQAMKHLADIEKGYEVDWKRDDIYIVEKEAKQCMSLSDGEIKNMLIDHFSCQLEDVSGNDDSYNTVKEAFDKMDFKPFDDAIEKVLEEITSYHSTDIKLIP